MLKAVPRKGNLMNNLKRITLTLLLLAPLCLLASCGSDDQLSNRIYDAVTENNVEELTSCLNSGNVDLENCKAAKEETGDGRILATALMNYPDSEEICKSLIDAGADMNSVDSDGVTYVQQYVDECRSWDVSQKLEVLQFLLAMGADVNQESRSSYAEKKMSPMNHLIQSSPLEYSNYGKVYQCLADHGAVIDQKTLKGCLKSDSRIEYLPLILNDAPALNKDIPKAVQAIVKGLPDKEILETMKEETYSKKERNLIACFASAYCDEAVLEALVKKEYDLQFLTASRMTMLDIAAMYNGVEAVEFMLSQGIDPETTESSYEIDTEDTEPESELIIELMRVGEPSSYTSITYALLGGRKENVSRLQEEGLKFQKNSWCLACFYQNPKAMDILSENEFKGDDYFRFECFISGSAVSVEELIRHGISSDLTVDGETVIEALQAAGNKERIDLIKKYENKYLVH